MSKSKKQPKEFQFKCKKCGTRWSDGSVSCPVCKKPIDKKQLDDNLARKPGVANEHLKEDDPSHENPDIVVIGMLSKRAIACTPEEVIGAMRGFYKSNEAFRVYHVGDRLAITYKG